MTKPAKTTGDVVLQEIWRIRVGDFFSLSAIWGEGWGEVIPCSTDVDRLFADARKRKKLSGHPVVNRQTKRRKA